MGHSGLNWLKKEIHSRSIYQHHGAVQPHTAIPRLTIVPLRSHTACTDRHWAWEKQPAKLDHSSLAGFDCEIR